MYNLYTQLDTQGELVKQWHDDIVQLERILMKKTIIALIVFSIGLAVAQYFFDVDVEGLAEGTLTFLSEILDGPD